MRARAARAAAARARRAKTFDQPSKDISRPARQHTPRYTYLGTRVLNLVLTFPPEFYYSY
jgi:hypothetical protein